MTLLPNSLLPKSAAGLESRESRDLRASAILQKIAKSVTEDVTSLHYMSSVSLHRILERHALDTLSHALELLADLQRDDARAQIGKLQEEVDTLRAIHSARNEALEDLKESIQGFSNYMHKLLDDTDGSADAVALIHSEDIKGIFADIDSITRKIPDDIS